MNHYCIVCGAEGLTFCAPCRRDSRVRSLVLDALCATLWPRAKKMNVGHRGRGHHDVKLPGISGREIVNVASFRALSNNIWLDLWGIDVSDLRYEPGAASGNAAGAAEAMAIGPRKPITARLAAFMNMCEADVYLTAPFLAFKKEVYSA